MSRSGYSDDGCDYLELYRATVDRSIKGKRGQTFLKELAAAMDAMPEKKLITNELITETGEVCAIGALCKAKGLDVSEIDVDDRDAVGKLMNISPSMAAEIVFENDERHDWAFQYSYNCERKNETPEERWVRMRKWVQENLVVGGGMNEH